MSYQFSSGTYLESHHSNKNNVSALPQFEIEIKQIETDDLKRKHSKNKTSRLNMTELFCSESYTLKSKNHDTLISLLIFFKVM